MTGATSTPAGDDDSRALLDTCRFLLTHDDWMLSHWGARGAAHLARQAIEEILEHYWDMQAPAVAGTSMRAMFLALHAFVDDAGGIADGYATWCRLSRACHHHPYDLAPTSAEVQQWVEAASRFCERLAAEGRRAPIGQTTRP